MILPLTLQCIETRHDIGETLAVTEFQGDSGLDVAIARMTRYSGSFEVSDGVREDLSLDGRSPC
jgi:hypothetical protein